ncbi:MAG: effector binding domain-containing protein [Verrucomicrobia bacterium]|nr:effector binding domain-containing protein [Verrucomicrobiota bacterium]
MDYTVIEKGPMQIMGIDLRTTNENWQSARDLPPFWGKFYREQIQMQIPNQKTGEVLGLYCEYEKDHTKPYTLVAGCEVTVAGSLPKGLVIKHVPAARYAVFKISGKFPAQLMEVWQWIWKGNLKRTFVADFELYPLGFHPETNPDLLLYVGIK